MVIPPRGAPEPTGDIDTDSRQQPFVVEGSVARFAPQLFPETIRVRKQRKLNRTQGFCAGEDVVDEGTKNREVHVTGRLRGFEIEAFHDLLDTGEPMELTSSTWSGEVYVKEGEVEGPDGYFPRDNELYWTYTLDLVSTGLDEPQNSGNGVVSGRDVTNPFAEDVGAGSDTDIATGLISSFDDSDV
jgi:hypothetical protein